MTPSDADARAAAGVRALVKNALSLLGAYVLPRLFTVGAVILAARQLGTERFGAYGAAAAFAVILSILGTLGMHTLLVRDLAHEPVAAPRLLRAAHVVKTGANALMLALVWLLAGGVIGLEGEARAAALLLAIGYALAAYAENFSAYFQAVERMHVWTEASALFGLVTGCLGAVLVVTTDSVAWFCVAPVAGQAAALGWLMWRAPRAVLRGEPARRSDVVMLLRELAPFAAAFVVLTLHYKLDVLVVKRLRSDADVGLYTAAYKFVDIYHALVLIGIGALYPRLARAARQMRDGLHLPPAEGARWAGARAAELCLLVAVPIAAMLHLLAADLVGLLFGPDYAAAAPATALLAFALPALALNLLGGYLLGAAHRMGRVATLYAASLALKTALDVALVPRLGPVGAAAAMVGAEGALAVGMLVMLHRHAHAAPGARVLAAALAAGALIAPARWLDAAVGGWVAVPAYAALVVVLYAAAGVVHARERRVLGLALRPRTAAAGAS